MFYFREVAAKELGELGAKGEEMEACESGVASDLPAQSKTLREGVAHRPPVGGRSGADWLRHRRDVGRRRFLPDEFDFLLVGAGGREDFAGAEVVQEGVAADGASLPLDGSGRRSSDPKRMGTDRSAVRCVTAEEARATLPPFPAMADSADPFSTLDADQNAVIAGNPPSEFHPLASHREQNPSVISCFPVGWL